VPTVLYDYWSAKTKGRWKRLMMILALAAVSTGALAYLLDAVPILSRGSPTGGDNVPTRVPIEVPESQRGKVVNPKEESALPPSVSEKTHNLAQITLRGVPRSATVLLDGREVMLLEGKIVLPADGAPRVLEVRAENCVPYRTVITPLASGEMEINLKKKRASPKKPVKIKERNQKTKPGLMECPYPE